MSNNTDNVQDIIQALKELDKSNSYEIFLPSLQKEIPFKQLNAEQFKRILKTVIDSPVYNTEFIVTFNSIIKENILEPTVNTEKLNIFDKLLILLKTRIDCIDLNYTFTFTDDEIKNNNLTSTNSSINLKEVYDAFVKELPNFSPKEYTYQQCSVICDLPTLDIENKLEKELHKNVKLEISTPEELRLTLGDTFINELSKYIQTIKVNETVFSFDTLNFKSRVKVVEQLPSTAVNKVLKYIEEYKKLTTRLTSYKLQVDGTEINKELPLDATLFNV
jgi:hypothetical protein